MGESRDSEAGEETPATIYCAEHDLWHQRSRHCWKCVKEAANKAYVEAVPDPGSIGTPVRKGSSQDKAFETEVVASYGGIEIHENTRSEAPPGAPAALHTMLDEFYDPDAPSSVEILQVCLELGSFLVKKNKAYGDSALKPLRILSKAGPAEQIRIRMDDKLSRLMRGEAAGEDTLHDLVGYWVLMKVAEAGDGGG